MVRDGSLSSLLPVAYYEATRRLFFLTLDPHLVTKLYIVYRYFHTPLTGIFDFNMLSFEPTAGTIQTKFL
jgi:hypothetical protein